MRLCINYKSLPVEMKSDYSVKLIEPIKKIHEQLNISIDKLKREIFLINEQIFITDRSLLFPKPEITNTNTQRLIIFKSRKKGLKENHTDTTETYVNVYFQKNSLINIKFNDEVDRLITLIKNGILYIGFTTDETTSYKMAKVGESYSSNLSKEIQKNIVCGEYEVDVNTIYTGENNQKYYKLTLINRS